MSQKQPEGPAKAVQTQSRPGKCALQETRAAAGEHDVGRYHPQVPAQEDGLVPQEDQRKQAFSQGVAETRQEEVGDRVLQHEKRVPRAGTCCACVIRHFFLLQ